MATGMSRPYCWPPTVKLSHLPHQSKSRSTQAANQAKSAMVEVRTGVLPYEPGHIGGTSACDLLEIDENH